MGVLNITTERKAINLFEIYKEKDKKYVHTYTFKGCLISNKNITVISINIWDFFYEFVHMSRKAIVQLNIQQQIHLCVFFIDRNWPTQLSVFSIDINWQWHNSVYSLLTETDSTLCILFWQKLTQLGDSLLTETALSSVTVANIEK